jgi:hypothetical protein
MHQRDESKVLSETQVVKPGCHSTKAGAVPSRSCRTAGPSSTCSSLQGLQA